MELIKEIWDIQADLNRRVIDNYDSIPQDPQKQAEWIRNYCLAISQEVSETIDSTPWKWWKKMDLDTENIKVEIVDIFHFLVSLAQVTGMSAEDFVDLYKKKLSLNHKRQDGGYKDGTYTKLDNNGEEDNKQLFK